MAPGAEAPGGDLTAESDSTVFKIIIFIFVTLFISTMLTQPWVYVGQPIPEDSTWGRFSSQLDSFPVFSNPFGQQNVNFDMAPSGFRNDSFPSYVVNGTMLSFWSVLADANESSYVGMNASQTTLRFNMSSVPGDYLLVGFSLEVWCRSNGTTGYFSPEFQNFEDTADNVMYLTTPNDVVTCPEGPTWTKNVVGGQNAEGLSMGNVSRLIFRIHKSDALAADRSTPAMEFAYFHMTVTGLAVTTCSSPPGAWFPWADELACQVGQGLVAAWRFVGLIVGGLIFAGQVLIWFVSGAALFVAALGSLFVGSDMPPIISGIVGAIMIGFIFLLGLIFFSKIRGGGP